MSRAEQSERNPLGQTLRTFQDENHIIIRYGDTLHMFQS